MVECNDSEVGIGGVDSAARQGHSEMKIICYHLSMRKNCCTIRTAVRAIWSGAVFPTMHVSFMTLVSVKVQAAFPL